MTDYAKLRAFAEAERAWVIQVPAITVLELLDKLERYEVVLDDIMNIHDYQDRGNESYWLAKRALNHTEANDD